MNLKRNNLFLILLLFVLAFPAWVMAQDLPFNIQPTGMVNDFAEIIPPQQQQRLELKLRNYRDSTTTVLAVATLPDLKGYGKQEVATYLFTKWKLWDQKKFNGVLILVAPKEQEVRIEVGYGLEGSITDIMAGRIVRRILIPEFKKGNFYIGLDEATTAMIELASGRYQGNLTKSRSGKRGSSDMASFIIFLLFIVFVAFRSAGRRGGGKNGGRRHSTLGPAGWMFLGMGMGGGRGGFGGGGFGGGGGGGFGGFGGMGGFGSGGGGAGGGW